MSKAYKSISSDSGEKYQKSQKVGSVHTEDDVKGTMEKPSAYLSTEGGKSTGKGAKNVMDKMKYAPKTVSYAEFTNAKRNAKLQSMAGSDTKDESSKAKMEDLDLADLPSHKRERSFNIDVTSYKPRKAKG